MTRLASLFALMALTPTLSYASSVIYEITGAHATVYYDLTNELCGDTAAGDPFPADWALGINGGYPYCQGQSAKTLNDLGTNRIVAINQNLVWGDPAEYCGKEVQIVQADGTVLDFPEGPLFIWDSCEACASNPIVDVSAKVFTQLKGGSCAGNNPGGLTVRVLDNNIWAANSGGGDIQPKPSSSGSNYTATGTSSTVHSAQQSATTTAKISGGGQQGNVGGEGELPTTIQKGENVVITSASPVVSSLSSAPSPTPSAASPSGPSRLSADGNKSSTAGSKSSAAAGNKSRTSSISPSPTDTTTSCVYGKWQCNGLALQVCNYVSLTQLDWETIATCGSVCEITVSGSVDCQ
ncbi:hypothetical protein DB88DRAFT_540051 [Papiliotrema laurentii]|uniref:Uncharacterized protein n=1 Tax=Papiliotrema laurentii TaxID=5418 RepID=A0AAD9D0K6_PAPLA|nr:hypothetical protein DB88DRAFT_540051 [Papiliotrema laurentii]